MAFDPLSRPCKAVGVPEKYEHNCYTQETYWHILYTGDSKSSPIWYITSDFYDIEIKISHCPWCGIKLEVKSW